MTSETILLMGLLGPLTGAFGFLLRRYLATERPFLATIKHQDKQLEILRRQLAEDRHYIRQLVNALNKAGIDVPEPPAEVY